MTRNSKNRWKGLACCLLFLCLFLFTVVYTQCDLVLFWKRRSHLTDLLSGMFPMDFAYIPHILTPLFYTIQMSVTGTVIGSVLACILAPACAGSMDFPKWIRYVLRFLIQIPRQPKHWPQPKHLQQQRKKVQERIELLWRIAYHDINLQYAQKKGEKTWSF